MIRILDLFTGVGGFVAAANQIGDIEHVALCEIDKACQELLRSKFPNIQLYTDVTKIDPSGVEFDILCGGFPCQPYSRNGKYYNKNNKVVPNSDKRANLFLEVVRILKTNQPKAFLLENVKELLTIKNEDGDNFIDVILSELRLAGYNVQYQVICPTDFGIPQQRKRVFIVGIRSDIQNTFKYPEKEKLIKTVVDYMDPQVDSKYLLENLWRNRKLNKNKLVSRLDALKAAYASGTWKPLIAPERSESVYPVAIIYGDTPSGLPRQQDKLYSALGISPTIATFSTPAFDHHTGWRVLTPRECLRLQSFPEDHPILHKDSAAYKQAGNAVNVEVAKRVMENIIKTISS
jgi:DNA (cytosine-5)-methyltransferase 1